MAKGKAKTIFFCTSCGGESVRWMGKCPHCGEWNTLVEEKVQQEAAPTPGRVTSVRAKACPIRQVDMADHQRMLTGIDELDTVLGGGLIPGCSVLLGGEPGIGKSTLLLQTSQCVSRYGKVLYVSGEESAAQIRSRAERLNALDDNIYLLTQTDIDAALEEAAALSPRLLVVDSVQALFSAQLDSAPGSVSQVRAVAAAALGFAREHGCTVLLIGHVTKEGALAGPRVLEHMVDTVLSFEGDRYHAIRMLRAVKNRFGSTNEMGVFEMNEHGLQALHSPSAYFLSQRHLGRPGSAVSCIMQGTRPLLLEVQALVTSSNFGNPRRLSTGYDSNRMQLILAVLERRMGLRLGDKDVYVNIVGGLRVDDAAADLAVAAAIASSLKDVVIEDKLLLLGELGLLGELRPVGQLERRTREAQAFGFSSLITPASGADSDSRLRVLTADDLPVALKILGL